jgi:hypothetical protein
MEYELEERATVAGLFLKWHDDPKEHQLFQLRIDVMRNLIKLCRRQESRKPSTKTQQYPSHQDESSKAIQTPNDEVKIDLSVLDEQILLRRTFYCPFCRCDEEAGLLKPNKLFARVNGLCRHVRVQHLKYMQLSGFICPYQGCLTPLKGTMSFLKSYNTWAWSMSLTYVVLSCIVLCCDILCRSVLCCHSIIWST